MPASTKIIATPAGSMPGNNIPIEPLHSPIQTESIPMETISTENLKELLKSKGGRKQLDRWVKNSYLEYLTTQEGIEALRIMTNLEDVKMKLRGFLFKEFRKLAMWIALSIVILSPQAREQVDSFLEDLAMKFVDEEGLRAYADRTNGWDAMLEEWNNGGIDKSLSWDMGRNLQILAGTVLAPILSLSSTATKISALFTTAPTMVMFGIVTGILDILTSVGGVIIPGITAIKGAMSMMRLLDIKRDQAHYRNRLQELRAEVADDMLADVDEGLRKLEPHEIETMIDRGRLDMDLILSARNREDEDMIDISQNMAGQSMEGGNIANNIIPFDFRNNRQPGIQEIAA